MATEPFLCATVDSMLNGDNLSVAAAAQLLRAVHELVCETRLAEAHVVGYIRERLDLGDFDDDPKIIRDILEGQDDD